MSSPVGTIRNHCIEFGHGHCVFEEEVGNDERERSWSGKDVEKGHKYRQVAYHQNSADQPMPINNVDTPEAPFNNLSFNHKSNRVIVRVIKTMGNSQSPLIAPSSILGLILLSLIQKHPKHNMIRSTDCTTKRTMQNLERT
ncbi:hypothetical protein ACMD2_18137 [Ananas comosus]|uniref:Uncharacterized protein n=1 Tax=Ananas comosus TaxID=4615 RepID=A0A199VN07_ANACO|nr:hypothetical protein ACMD2_18137 [Ananas comosus]